MTGTTARRHVPAITALAAALLLAACGDKPADTPAGNAPAQAPASDNAAPAGQPPQSAAAQSTAPQASTAETAAAGAADSAPASTGGDTTSSTAAPAAGATTTTAASTGTTAGTAGKNAPATTTGTSTSGATEPGSMTRADALREKPFADAREITTLAAGTAVSIAGREGGWYQVSSGGKSGWVRMLSVRRSSSTTSGGSIDGLAAVASGRTGTGTVVTTTGIRGLDSQALQVAAFNEERVAYAESLRTPKPEANAYARKGGLAVRDVPMLPAPQK